MNQLDNKASILNQETTTKATQYLQTGCSEIELKLGQIDKRTHQIELAMEENKNSLNRLVQITRQLATNFASVADSPK